VPLPRERFWDVQAYNALAALDIDSHLTVENHFTQQPNDKQEVEPALGACRAWAIVASRVGERDHFFDRLRRIAVAI
jgi:hypothetical protein